MKKPVGIFRRSLSARLSMWTVAFAASVFLAALGYIFVVARDAVRREAFKGATRELDNTVLRVNSILEDIEIIANNLEWQIYADIDKPEKMMEYSRQVVLSNSILNGCSISFEPYFYPSEGLYYSCYSNRVDNTVLSQQEGNDEYQYFYREWYLLPKLLNQSCWTEPYTDQEEADDGSMDSKMSVSYCRPLTSKDDSFIGSLSLDISLEWLSETISHVKPYPNSYSILISRGGTFLVHPNPELLFYQTIFTDGLVNPQPELWQLGQDMVSWKEGMSEFTRDGNTYYVFYKPMMTTGWSVGLVCTEKDIFGSFIHFQTIVVLIVLVGLLLMFALFARIIRHHLSPLRDLASQAEEIASGHFDNLIPQTRRQDEIGVLNRSFRFMQSSLVNYIKELTETTAKKERIEGELQIARNIQMGMVPRVFPPFPDRKDIDLFASITPAKEVGGDLYDYFIQNEKLYFCIGDVSGKGVPASLFMAVARNLYRLLSQQGLPPSEVARYINDTLAENNEELMFVTMFLGVVDLSTGVLEYCNCGHNPPVVLDGGPRFLDCLPNTPIGISVGLEFQGQRIDSFKDTPLLLYTDGLNEAENISHEELGNDRMMAAIASAPFTTAEELISRLRITVAQHVGTAEPSDDLTMLCIKVS